MEPREEKGILVTGAAGFIGFHLARRLLEEGRAVAGLDNLNPYYDTELKKDRLKLLKAYPGFTFAEVDLADREKTARVFENNPFGCVVHLAAQAGVRYSLENPEAYVDSNLVGFANVLEGCRRAGAGHLVFASSSSVYGSNIKQPYAEDDPVDHPISLYAATKKANELMAHSYAHLYGLPCTGLRFFTVYGPWGRPDMAPILFAGALFDNKPISVFNNGRMERDFTYIDDIIEGLVRVMARVPGPDPDWTGENPRPATSHAPYRIYNIGNNRPVGLLDFIQCMERATGKKAQKIMMPIQPGDVVSTCADIDALARDTGFSPHTPLEEGMKKFIDWFRTYYGPDGHRLKEKTA